MDYLQYKWSVCNRKTFFHSFKPYYKWITFNTLKSLAISYGLKSFKPYYKWITFNTKELLQSINVLVLCFKPYYKWITFNTITGRIGMESFGVLNLIINGLPSIQYMKLRRNSVTGSFKPYYKWITFNTVYINRQNAATVEVF